MLLPLFGLASALAYGLNKRRLVGAWLLVEIGFLDTFYLCVFDPQNFGWSVAYTFAHRLAIGVLVAFDMDVVAIRRNGAAALRGGPLTASERLASDRARLSRSTRRLVLP